MANGTRNASSSAVAIRWNLVEPLLLHTKADIFILIDSGISLRGGRRSDAAEGVVEILAASDSSSSALAPGPNSFTTNLIEVLQKFSSTQVFSIPKKSRNSPRF